MHCALCGGQTAGSRSVRISNVFLCFVLHSSRAAPSSYRYYDVLIVIMGCIFITVEAASAHEAARAQAMEITAELDYTSAVAKAVFLAIDRPPRDAHRRDRLSPRRRRRPRGVWLTTRRAPRGDLARVQTAPHGRVRLGFNLD